MRHQQAIEGENRKRSNQGKAWNAMKILIALLSLVPSSMAITKKKFDFVIGVNGDFKAAMAAAASKASATNRFYIFFPDGEYNIGALTGNVNQKTVFPTSNVSFIGQSTEKTVIFNKSIQEGIDTTATLNFKNADNLYLQDLTVYNKANYGNTASYNETGRHVAIQEQGKKFIYKNVKLLSTQDTYYSKGTKTYWENGEIHGTTDFICGSGDVYFNTCKIFALKKSALTAASSTSNTYGYVFKNCTIDGNAAAAGYTLGRSWNDARTVFIGTTMKLLPSDAGWGDPMNSVPKVFAEYQSKNSSGALLDLSKRRTSYTKNSTTVTLNPRLTDAQATQYTVEAVLAGTDNWQPQTQTLQIPAPVIRIEGSSITWEDNANALNWTVFKNGKFLANVITNSYEIATLASGDVLTVRAANAMGGLGALSNAITIGTGPQDPSIYQAEFGILTEAVAESKNTGYAGDGYANFNAVQGSTVAIPVSVAQAGQAIVTITFSNGSGTVRQLAVSVNGSEQIASTDFAATTDWATWGTKEISLTLKAGANTITFSTVNGTDGPNLDQISLKPGTTELVGYAGNGEFSIHFDSELRELSLQGVHLGITDLKLYSTSGVQVYSGSISFDHGFESKRISIPQVPSGTYYLRWVTPNTIGTQAIEIP